METYKINEKEYTKDWLDLAQVYNDNIDWVKIICCIGDNSIGKTFSVENLFMEAITKDEHCVWIRWSKENAKRCVQEWRQVINRFNLSNSYKVDETGVYRMIDKNTGKTSTKPIKSFDLNYQQVMSFVYLSSLDNSISSFSERVRYFCIDEVLQGNESKKIIMKSPFRNIKNMMKRLCRNMVDFKPILFLLGNPWDLENDILADFNIEYDWEKLYMKQDDIDCDFERGIIRLGFPTSATWSNERLIEQHTFFDTLKVEDDYEFKEPRFRRVINEPSNKTAIVNFTIGGKENKFTIFEFKRATGESALFVDICNFLNRDLKNYCFNIKDVAQGSFFLTEGETILSVFSFIWKYKMRDDSVYFKSPYCQKWFNEVLAIVEISRRADK